MKFLFGALLILSAVFFMVLINGDWQLTSVNIFVDAPSLLFLLLILFGFTIVSGSQRVFSNGVTAAFNKSFEFSNDDRAKSIAFFKQLRRASFYAGWLSFIIHFVMMLGNLDDINVIVSGLVLSSVALLYAALLSLVFISPVISRLKNGTKND